ncbi:MAG: DUF2752 domain-containing protein [Kiritimatiellia bacterium]|nr:DUF2752 domain-containing protein [Kiritimatiellia bacterium]
MSLFIDIDRPAEQTNYWNTFAGNLFLLLFSGGILVTAFLFPIDRVPLGFCVFLHLTGFPCPTCGFSRAFCAFARGIWAAGIHNCPLAPLVYLSVIAVFAYNAAVTGAALFGLQIRRGQFLRLSSKKTVVLAVVLFLLLLANWIYRLIMGLK